MLQEQAGWSRAKPELASQPDQNMQATENSGQAEPELASQPDQNMQAAESSGQAEPELTSQPDQNMQATENSGQADYFHSPELFRLILITPEWSLP